MFVSLWVPNLFWLNCPSTTPIIIIYPPLYIYTYKAVCLLVCGSPPPVWLNCPSPTPIIIIYHTLTTTILYQFALLQVVYINSVSCQVAFTIFRICILSQYKIFILILFFVEFFEIIWLIFEKSLFLSYILRSDNIYNLCQLHFYKF